MEKREGDVWHMADLKAGTRGDRVWMEAMGSDKVGWLQRNRKQLGRLLPFTPAPQL